MVIWAKPVKLDCPIKTPGLEEVPLKDCIKCEHHKHFGWRGARVYVACKKEVKPRL